MLALLCIAAYAGILNNGFIADDYVFLQIGEQLKSNPLYLYELPPFQFRTTTFAAFAVLHSVFGYRPEAFYAFTIAVHFANCLLLWKFLRLLGRTPLESWLAAAFFAVFHAPNEAVMWLSPMQENLLGLCVLGTLILWLKQRYGLSLLCYCLALQSKEAAPVLLGFLVLLQLYRGERVFRGAFPLYLVPTAVFGVLFLTTWQSNSMIQHNYDFGMKALAVLGLTLHRLVWPWLYIFIAIGLAAGRKRIGMSTLAFTLGAIAVAMSPYVFLNYQRALPSRHLYLACMLFAALLAHIVTRSPINALSGLLIAVFIGFNIGYLALRKDGQFEERAAPTTRLLEIMQSRAPGDILVQDFAYPNAEVARDVAWLVPGWKPEFIHVAPQDTCAGCAAFRWDRETASYILLPASAVSSPPHIQNRR